MDSTQSTNSEGIATIEPSCKTCKTGKILLEAHAKGKIAMTKASQIHGHRCALCMYNGIGKRKAWALKKVIPGFQESDMYEEVEKHD